MELTGKMMGIAEYAVILTALLALVASDSGQPHVVAWLIPVLALAIVSLASWAIAARDLARGHDGASAAATGRVTLYLWAVGSILSLGVPLAELVLR